MANNPNVETRDKHPANRPIVTPKGEWPSVSLAALAEGVARMTVYRRLQRGEPGWRYAERSTS